MTTEVRLVEPGDAEALATHLARDRNAMARWNPAQPDRWFTVEGQAERVERFLAELGKGLLWPGVVLSNGTLVGQVTISSILRDPFRKGSIGYWIGSAHENQGHATRALAQVLEVMTGELGLHRAEAGTQIENLASQRVLRANGFTPYGIAHSCVFIDGAWRDDVMWERALGD